MVNATDLFDSTPSMEISSSDIHELRVTEKLPSLHVLEARISLHKPVKLFDDGCANDKNLVGVSSLCLR
jgi:hypothetical protein